MNYFIIGFILNGTVHISGPIYLILKMFCLIIINKTIMDELIVLPVRNKSHFAHPKKHVSAGRQPGASYAQRSH